MAISDKERARQIIDQLPDDATLDDMARCLKSEADASGHGEAVVLEDSSETDSSPQDMSSSEIATFHLERRGRVSVLVADRPLPPITVDMVNDLIDEMRREREDQWLSPAPEDES